ncbi:MAG: sensor histidine kinase [Saprospiraceae bacterium]|nr:sensor histidine kinase [Saprospiraceae bacterium]
MKNKLITLIILLIYNNINSQDYRIFYPDDYLHQTKEHALDSVDKKIASLIQQKKFFEAVEPSISLIQKYTLQNDQNNVHKYRFILGKLYGILGWYSRSISTLEYCHIYFAQNKMSQDLVRTCLLMAMIQYKANKLDQAAYLAGVAEAEKPSKNNPFFQNKLLLLNTAIKDSVQDSSHLVKLGKVLKYAKASKIFELEAMSYRIIGDYYEKKDQLSQACLAYQIANHIFDSLGYQADQLALHQKIYRCLQGQELYKEANLELLKYIAINDSLTQTKTKGETFKIIDKFDEKENREEKIDLAKNQRLFELKSRRSNFTMISLLFGIGAILIAVFLIILFYQQKLNANEIILKQSDEINQQKIKELENSITLQTMQSMIRGQEVERERIAKDLHDSLGGLLSTIKLRFDKLSFDHAVAENPIDHQKVHGLIDEACKEVRNIAHDLKPNALDNLGLLDALRDLINRYQNNSGPDIFLQTHGLDDSPLLHSENSTQVYRIIQELVHNAFKHAKAKEIFVQVQIIDEELEITVEDDGVGYDLNTKTNGMGLANIQSRVKYLNGQMEIDSRMDQGTSVMIQIPLGKPFSQGKP